MDNRHVRQTARCDLRRYTTSVTPQAEQDISAEELHLALRVLSLEICEGCVK